MQHRCSVTTVLDGRTSSTHYNSGTFPGRRTTAKGGAKARMIHRNASTLSAVKSRAVSQNPSNLDAPEVILTRSKSLQDLREDLARTSRGALEKREESELATHRSALGREIQVRTRCTYNRVTTCSSPTGSACLHADCSRCSDCMSACNPLHCSALHVCVCIYVPIACVLVCRNCSGVCLILERHKTRRWLLTAPTPSTAGTWEDAAAHLDNADLHGHCNSPSADWLYNTIP